MRSKYKATFAAIVAMLTLGGLAATPALAELPEFKPAYPPGKLTFGVGGINKFETSRETTWLYSSFNSTTSGELTGLKTFGNVTFKFHESLSEFGCNNEPNRGLTLAGLKGRLGYINKSQKTVGVMFEPVKQPIAKCKIIGQSEKEYLGDVIAKISPIGVKTKKFTLTFSQTSGKQNPLWFEGETEKFPQNFPFTLGKLACQKPFFEKEAEKCELKESEGLGVEDTVEMETEHETWIEA